MSKITLVRRYGGASTDALLDPKTQIFTIPEVEGLIGYRQTDGHAIVYGDPVCPQENLHSLVNAFHEHCKQLEWNYVFISASRPFADWYSGNLGGAKMEIGSLLSLDPHDDPKEKHGNHASLLRRKTRHALKEGVAIHEYAGNDSQLETAIEDGALQWQKNRKGPQVHISNLRLFDNRQGKRWFYATAHNNVVGSLTLNQLEEAGGWLLNHVTYTPTAPHGTQELLVSKTIDTLKEENCRKVIFGMTPASSIGEITGFGHIFTLSMHALYPIVSKLLGIGGHQKFWEKFHPASEPAYLIFDKPHLNWSTLKSLKEALNVKI